MTTTIDSAGIRRGDTIRVGGDLDPPPEGGWARREPDLNAFLRNAFEDLGESVPIAFFCECDRRCDRPVWLMLSEYELVRASPNAHVLRPGHA